MVSFLCDCCNYKTDIKCNFVRHLKSFKHIKKADFYGVTKNYKKLLNFKTQKDPKKTQKDPKRPKKTQQITEKSPKNCYFVCIFCSYIYSTFAHQRRHELHRCKHPEAIKHRKLLISNRVIKELKKEHKKTIEMLISKIGTTNNTFINSNNNIQINSYGNEDMSHISDTLKTQMLNSPYSMIPKMIEEKKLAPFKNQTSEPLSTLSVAWMMWCNGATCNLTPLLSPPLHATTTHTHTTAWLTYAQQRLSLARHNIRFDSTL